MFYEPYFSVDHRSWPTTATWHYHPRKPNWNFFFFCLKYVIIKIVCLSMTGTFMVKIVILSMAEMCHGQNRLFWHSWNVSWTKLSVPAYLEYVIVKIVRFSMSGRLECHGQNRLFQHSWNLSRSKLSVLACLEYVMVNIVRFSLAGMYHGQYRQFPHVWKTIICHGQNRQFQYGWNVLWSKSSKFSMIGMCHGQNCQFQHGWNV
jgi:hypothetical protein